MSVERFYTPGLAEVAYIVFDEASKEAAIIDPRRDIDEYLDWAKAHHARFVAICETHVHADFVSGAREMAAATGAPVYAGKHGLTAGRLEQLPQRRWVDPGTDLDLAARAIGGMTGLTKESSTFDRRDVLRAWCERHPTGAGVERIERLTDRWLASPYATRLDEVKPSPTSGPRYSTPSMLQTEQELIDFCKARLPGYKVPKSIEFWESLPTTPVGKILRKDIKKKFWEDHERSSG